MPHRVHELLVAYERARARRRAVAATCVLRACAAASRALRLRGSIRARSVGPTCTSRG